jgi:hypothetical protein
MPQPRKTLLELALIDRTFLARRHAELLVADELVDEPRLCRLQQAYREEQDGLERRRLAVAFEKVVREPASAPTVVELALAARMAQSHSDRRADPEAVLERESGTPRVELQAELEALVTLPAVPMELAHTPRLYARYWRARRAAERSASGRTRRAVSAELGVSAATVMRDLAWLELWDGPPEGCG